MREYLGHENQISGAELYRLDGGKGDGMRVLQVRNGKGLDFSISLDRCADISRLSFQGMNMGFFSPCGYVAPQYYQRPGAGFLQSFTAGFLTTCGLTAAGAACIDQGEEVPLHGTISHTPAEEFRFYKTGNEIIAAAVMREASLFGHQLILERQYRCSLTENSLTICDTVENTGVRTTPLMLLYHFNMGYPLLCEQSVVRIPAEGVRPRNGRAAQGMDVRLEMEKPQKGFEEQCYYYDMKESAGWARAGIFNPEISAGLRLLYRTETLDSFIEWKMMGEREYVLGLEPANCTPDGRSAVRERGELRLLDPGERYETEITIDLFRDQNSFEEAMTC